MIDEPRNEFDSIRISRKIYSIRKQKPPQSNYIDSVIKFSNSVRKTSGNIIYLCDPTELTYKLPTMLYYERVSIS